MSRKQTCCVPGCRDTISVRHRIPVHSARIYDVWIERIGNPTLYGLNKETVSANYKICGNHFIPECTNPGSSRLKIYTLPSLNLPAFQEEGSSENSFLYPPDVVDKLQRQQIFEAEELVHLGPTCEDAISESQTTHSWPIQKSVEDENDDFPGISYKSSDGRSLYGKTYSKRCHVDLGSAHSGISDLDSVPVSQRDSSSLVQQSVVEDEDDFPSNMYYGGRNLYGKTYSKRCRVECDELPRVDISYSGTTDLLQTSNSCSTPVELHDVTKPSITSSSLLKTPRKKSNGTFKRGSILKSVGVTRMCDLTPKASALYGETKKLKKITTLLNKKVKSFRARVRLAEKFSTDDLFSTIVNKVDKVTFNLIRSQVANQCYKAKGRRFTCEDKIFALSLLKASPKGHKFLSQHFALPSKRTLTSLLGKIPFQPGINRPIMNHLKEVVSGLNELDKHCVLIFDEMKLQTHLQFNEKTDIIEGFEDFGQEQRSRKFADHGLVFMVRGLRAKWKQPIVYYFAESTTKTPVLVRCIKEVVREVTACGLKLVATVCDQAGPNEAAINSLLGETQASCVKKGKEYRYGTYIIDDVQLIPIFDAPHLLKGIRNNLLSKNLIFKWKNGYQTASWGHLEKFYDLDSSQGDGTSTCPRLTDEHVKVGRIKKMKVKNCAQVFSQRVSSIMRMLSKWGKKDCLPPEAADTADLFLFMDMLFDSVNGSSVRPKKGKLLRCAVTKTSPHVDFWHEAIQVLRTFNFVDKNGKKSRPPSVKNWERTLCGLKIIWSMLQKEGFKFFSLRSINQDPLENFFGCIRSHGIRNTMPSCSSFMSSFKTLVVNNFTSPHSLGSNCIKDDTQGSLDTLRVFLTDSLKQGEYNSDAAHDLDLCHIPFVDKDVDSQCSGTDENPLSTSTKVYISSYIARKVMKTVGDCLECRNNLFSTGSVENCEVITARAYTPTSLRYPTTCFSKTCAIAVGCIVKYLPEICYMKHVKNIITMLVLMEIYTSVFSCKIHELCKYVVNLVVNVYIHSWCRSVNRILCGRVAFVNSVDEIKKAARAKFLSTARYKVKS